jgi:hypothetical protein
VLARLKRMPVSRHCAIQQDEHQTRLKQRAAQHDHEIEPAALAKAQPRQRQFDGAFEGHRGEQEMQRQWRRCLIQQRFRRSD